jgi:hypothetical protein
VNIVAETQLTANPLVTLFALAIARNGHQSTEARINEKMPGHWRPLESGTGFGRPQHACYNQDTRKLT